MQPPKFPVDELRIDLDCTKCGSWVEIDAVNIVGQAAKSKTYIILTEGNCRCLAFSVFI